jgi:hypothetical protein
MAGKNVVLVMTGGMAGIAGTVLVLYATLLAPVIPDAAAHFVIASVLGAPAAILVSLIMVPETSDKRTGGGLTDRNRFWLVCHSHVLPGSSEPGFRFSAPGHVCLISGSSRF